MKSFSLLKHCYFSALDLECHTNETQLWTEIMEQLWPKYMPTQQLKKDFHPCQFVPAFGENYGTLFYSELWADVNR
jgi:Zn-dependent oligopeptidase